VFAYLLANNRKNDYEMIEEYITFYFETVMKKESHKISDKTDTYAQQLPDYYNSLELPEYIIKKLSFEKKNQFGISVKVIGFNSKKLDINIFLNYIIDEKIHIRSIVGTESQYKILTL
jgi:hypothetical protein